MLKIVVAVARGWARRGDLAPWKTGQAGPVLQGQS
jgi:hypothetical protein